MLQILDTDKALEVDLDDSERLWVGLNRIELEGSFYKYVKAAWHLVEPGVEFIDNWHLRKLCSELERVYYRDIKRKIFNVPPGTAKSNVVCVLWPTWVWAKNARKRFLLGSYGAHLTTRDNLRARQIVESDWYQSRWALQLQEDQNAKTRYNTADKGWRIATSVGGVGTGEHPDFIIIDDPTSASQAESEASRREANEWFDRTLSTRLGRNPCIVVIMQRLHEDDLSGHLINRGGWDVSRWPMRYEVCACATKPLPDPDPNARCAVHKADPDWTPDPTDERTVEGELLFPQLFPEDKVKQLELDLGPAAAGQLQQRPSPLAGTLFKREWFKFVTELPKLARWVRGWDTAGTEGGGDWTVGALIGEEFENKLIPAEGTKRARRELTSTGRFFVADVKRAQLGPSGVDAMILATAKSDGPGVPIREEKEGGSAGGAVIEARRKALKGYDYEGVQISGNKLTRAKPFRKECESGNVYLLRADWNDPYLRVLCNVPAGAHDDDMDASSCAFNAVLLEPVPRPVEITW